MDSLVNGIRSAVIMVVLLETAASLQAGHAYEKLIKTMTGLMVIYSLATAVTSFLTKDTILTPLEEIFADTRQYLQSTGEDAGSGEAGLSFGDFSDKERQDKDPDHSPQDPAGTDAEGRINVRIGDIRIPEIHIDDISVNPSIGQGW